MSNDGSISFLPFQALGTRHKPRGHSSPSNVFQPFYTTGASYGHMTASLTLPSLTMRARIRNDNLAEFLMTLPSLQLVMYTGATVSMTLPKLKLAGHLLNPNLMRITYTLPAIKAVGDMVVGGVSEVNEQLPMLLFFMRFGWKGAFTLPHLQASAHLSRKEDMVINMYLRPLQFTAHLTKFADAMHITMLLPAMQGAPARAEFRMTLPALRMHMVMHPDYTHNVTQAWAWNVKKNAMTRYTNYAYRTFVRFQNAYYGVGYDGTLYLLDGDTDNGAAIPWAWETGLDNMDSAAEKGILGVYISGRLERGAVLTLRTENNVVYTYRTTTDERVGRSDYRKYRVNTGRGIRSSEFGIGMQNPHGGRMMVARVAPYMVVTKRNV